MRKRIPSLNDFINESVLNEVEKISYKGNTYTYSFIKHKGEFGSSPSYSLLLTDKKTGTIYAFPRIFWYEEGWSQGTGRSEHGYYLNNAVTGGVGNGHGQKSPTTPIYVDDDIEDIISAWQGNYYSKDKIAMVKNMVQEFPKGTKKAEITKSLNW